MAALQHLMACGRAMWVSRYLGTASMLLTWPPTTTCHPCQVDCWVQQGCSKGGVCTPEERRRHLLASSTLRQALQVTNDSGLLLLQQQDRSL